MRYSLAIATALLIPLAGCDSNPTAPLDDEALAPTFAVVEQGWFPFDFPGQPICNELVDISGRFHINVSQTVSKNGNLHFKFHINAKGTGVGQTSGGTYQWNHNIVEVVNDAALPFTQTVLQTLKVVGKGGLPNFTLKGRFHVTVNANGDVTALYDRFEATCN